MQTIVNLLTDPMILLMIILFLGSWLGKIEIHGISLGVSGVLFIGMIFGHFGYEIPPTVQNLGLSLFIVSIGLQAGPRFFQILRTKGVIFGLLSVIVVLSSALTTMIVAKLFHLPSALSVGLMTGALTSTPGLAAALQATGDPSASVGYGIAYPFGVIAVILFIQFIPKLLKVDLKENEEPSMNPLPEKDAPHVMAIEITNKDLHKKSLSDLDISNRYTVVISRIIRNDRMIIATSDVVLLQGDQLVAVGSPTALDKVKQWLGREVELHLANKDHIQVHEVTVDAYDTIGKTIQELGLRKEYGITVTRIERDGLSLVQDPKMPLVRGDVLTIVSSQDRIQQVEQLFTSKDVTITNVHIFSLSFILLIGLLVGMIPIYLPGLGTITLGVAGGPLFVALIISHFGNVGPIRARYYIPANQVISDLGLALFLAGVGTNAGDGLLEVIQMEGIRLMIGGTIITITPILIGFFVARKWFGFSFILSLGALSGAMTSTPGLGTLNQLTSSEDAAVGYAAAYPFALIIIAIVSQLVPLLL